MLENGLRFTPAGGTVRVSLHPDGSVARLAGEDPGPGIPRHLLSAVFARYLRVESGIMGKTAGLGLGLAVCRAIVEDGHGGRIRAEAPGQGGAGS